MLWVVLSMAMATTHLEVRNFLGVERVLKFPDHVVSVQEVERGLSSRDYLSHKRAWLVVHQGRKLGFREDSGVFTLRFEVYSKTLTERTLWVRCGKLFQVKALGRGELPNAAKLRRLACGS